MVKVAGGFGKGSKPEVISSLTIAKGGQKNLNRNYIGE